MARNKSPVKKWLQENPIDSFGNALAAAGERPADDAERKSKKNYAQYLSEALAVLFAGKLRATFPSVLPTADGAGTESLARTGKGVKKLDVNYSTPQLGLGLGISIKTLNFRDQDTGRYTKNVTRIDNELRAEAMDYHQRQPYSVLVAVVFIPFDSCEDGDESRPANSWSSFAQAVNVLRHRAGRLSHDDDPQLFERVYVGLYGHQGAGTGRIVFFNVVDTPPQFHYPAEAQSKDLEDLIEAIVKLYDTVNKVVPAWVTNAEAQPPRTFNELMASGIIPSDEEDDSEDAEV